MLTQSWNPSLLGQCKDRVIRHPQKNNLDVFILHAKESLDVKTTSMQELKLAKATFLLDPDDR